MKRRVISSLIPAALTCVVAVAVVACGTLNREGVVAPQDGGSIVVRQGAPFVINLSADPTTGFGWMLTSDPGAAVWLIGGPDYTPDPIPAGLMGVGGTTTYRFRAEALGTTQLEFTFRRSWEQEVPPDKVVRYDVTVKDAGWQNWF